MKYRFFSLLISFILLNPAQALDFQEIVGCYETKLIDQKVPQYSDRYLRTLSSIESDISPSFSALDQSSLNHVIISLYTGSNGPWDSYHPFVLFPALGVTQSTPDSLSYRMDQDLLLWQNYRQVKVDHFIELNLKKLNEEEIEGSVSFASKHRMMSGQREFRLKRILCF